MTQAGPLQKFPEYFGVYKVGDTMKPLDSAEMGPVLSDRRKR